jgi:hypothetical protein
MSRKFKIVWGQTKADTVRTDLCTNATNLVTNVTMAVLFSTKISAWQLGSGPKGAFQPLQSFTMSQHTQCLYRCYSCHSEHCYLFPRSSCQLVYRKRRVLVTQYSIKFCCSTYTCGPLKFLTSHNLIIYTSYCVHYPQASFTDKN